MGGRPTLGGAAFRTRPLDQGGLYIAAVAVGVARGALDELAALAAGGKRPAFSRQRLAESPVFQDRVGAAHLELESARALLYAQAEKAWAAAVAGEELTLFERATLRATAAQVTASSARVVDAAYTLAGGSAVFDSCPLQRRLRDVHTATQHVHAGRYYFGIVGALIAGEAIDETLF
jgi:alkylation response protein AidB-like acyl-CoA dehydrogenase